MQIQRDLGRVNLPPKAPKLPSNPELESIQDTLGAARPNVPQKLALPGQGQPTAPDPNGSFLKRYGPSTVLGSLSGAVIGGAGLYLLYSCTALGPLFDSPALAAQYAPALDQAWAAIRSTAALGGIAGAAIGATRAWLHSPST